MVVVAFIGNSAFFCIFHNLPELAFTHTSVAVEVAGAGFVSRTLAAGGLLATYFW